MSRSQKTILAVLFVIACLLSGPVTYYAYTSYQVYAQRPLGPSVPQAQFTPLALPATWTPTPGDLSLVGLVTLAPTLAVPATNTPMPVCGGAGVMNILAIGADARTDNYQYGLAD